MAACFCRWWLLYTESLDWSNPVEEIVACHLTFLAHTVSLNQTYMMATSQVFFVRFVGPAMSEFARPDIPGLDRCSTEQHPGPFCLAEKKIGVGISTKKSRNLPGQMSELRGTLGFGYVGIRRGMSWYQGKCRQSKVVRTQHPNSTFSRPKFETRSDSPHPSPFQLFCGWPPLQTTRHQWQWYPLGCLDYHMITAGDEKQSGSRFFFLFLLPVWLGEMLVSLKLGISI
jgi:hypothetical protein